MIMEKNYLHFSMRTHVFFQKSYRTPVLDLWKSSGILLNYALAATPLPPRSGSMEKFRNITEQCLAAPLPVLDLGKSSDIFPNVVIAQRYGIPAHLQWKGFLVRIMLSSYL
jgi:hypothetical protein